MKLYRMLLFLLLPVACHAQLYSGVIDAARATSEWQNAGVTGGIPSGSWTQCGSTIAAGASAATINSAISSCAANHYVQLGAGTFNISGILFSGKNNVALRGMGADQTFLVATGESSCAGFGSVIVVCSSDTTYANAPPGTVYNWTAGYSQGTSTITLSGTSGISLNSTLIMLDQCDDGFTGTNCQTGSSTDTGNLYQCNNQWTSTSHGCATEGGTNNYRVANGVTVGPRGLDQIVQATSLVGNNVTLSQPVMPVNFRSGQSPQAWIVQPSSYVGIENLSLDATASHDAILAFNTANFWVSGVRINTFAKFGVRLFEAYHPEIVNSYIYKGFDPDPYGIAPTLTTGVLVQNTIFQQVRSCIVINGPDVGSVYAYNYFIGNSIPSSDTKMWQDIWNHSYETMQLNEGNIGDGFADDGIHGGHAMTTNYRNYWRGTDTGVTNNNMGHFSGFDGRYENIIANVLGYSGSLTYSSTDTFTDNGIYVVGGSNGGASPPVPSDPLASTTEIRWGNYDTVHAATQWNTGEVPSGISPYPNAVPTASCTSSLACPSSFYLSSKPSWWQSEPWPAIGPDVLGGTVYASGGSTTWVAQSVGGHANDNPALDCFKDVMGGPADGTGSVLNFNANTCYPATATPPAPAANLFVMMERSQSKP